VKVWYPTLAAWKTIIMLAADPSMVRLPAMMVENEACCSQSYYDGLA
jgi:hypothetical protein